MSNDKKSSSDSKVDESTQAPGRKSEKVTVLLVIDDEAITTITIDMPVHESEKDVVLRIFTMGPVLKEHFGFEMSDDCLVRIGRADNSHYLVEVKPLAISTPVKVTAVNDNPRFQYVFEVESPTVRPAENEPFSHLLNSKKFSDVTFCIEGKIIHAHKIVLANRSPVFDALFETECNKLEIQDFSYDTMFDLVHFVYKGKVTDDTAGCDLFRKFSNLLLADAKYCIDSLKEMCEIRLSMIITTENLLECFRLADKCNGMYLKRYALGFATANSREIAQTPSFQDFNTLRPDLLVEMMRALVINKNKT